MKLIIETPDHIYETVINTGTFGYYRFDTRKAIKKGIPLDKIRDEIADRPSFMMSTSEEYEKGVNAMLNQTLMIIDKYKTESEDIEAQATESLKQKTSRRSQRRNNMIAIKDFEMPKDCDSCPFYTYHIGTEDDCRITGEGLYHVKIGERHEKCPLVVLEQDLEKTGY